MGSEKWPKFVNILKYMSFITIIKNLEYKSIRSP